MGKEPNRNQNVTFDPNVGFILDPVTALDSGTYRCKGVNEIDRYLGYGRDWDWLIFTLDVSKYFTE